MLTVPSLFATDAGPHRCFYCGSPCGEVHSAKDWVKDSFTGRSTVPCPGSPWVCSGCVACLQQDADIAMIDGERRSGQKMQSYSWLCRPGGCIAGTKAHLAEWRRLCLDPPEPPFAIVLSDSGQRQLLYRGVVNHDRDPITVTLEEERITYRVAELKNGIGLATKIAAATGKPTLGGPIEFVHAKRLVERYRDGEEILEAWGRRLGTPLWRLTSWLCPNKEMAEIEYPSDSSSGV